MDEKKSGYLFLVIVIAVCMVLGVYKFSPFKIPFKRTVVTISQYWQEEANQQFLLPLIEKFHRENPEIEIRLSDDSFYNLEKEFKNAAQQQGKKVLPDIISVDQRWLSFLTQASLLEPLDGYFQKAGITENSTIIEEEKEKWTVPLVSFFYVLYYNISLLEKAGIDRPPKTQEEFLAYCRTLASGRNPQSSGIFCMALSPENPHDMEGELFSWIWASGFNPDLQNEEPFSSRSFIQAMGFINRLAQEKLLIPESMNYNESDKLESFINGRSAMMLASFSKIKNIKKQAEDLSFDISTVPYPASYTGKPVLSMHAWQAGISKSSKHKDEAWRFLSFLMEKSQNLDIALDVYGIPSNRNAIPELKKQDPFYEKALAILEAGEGNNGLDRFPVPIALENILRDETGSMLKGETNPEKAGRTIQEKWDEALSTIH